MLLDEADTAFNSNWEYGDRSFHKTGRFRNFIELAENAGGLNRSMQHWLAVYSREVQSQLPDSRLYGNLPEA